MAARPAAGDGGRRPEAVPCGDLNVAADCRHALCCGGGTEEALEGHTG